MWSHRVDGPPVVEPPRRGASRVPVDVTVIPMDRENTLAQQTVVVDGGRIVNLLSGEELGTQVIDSPRSRRALVVGMNDFTLA